MIVVTSDKAVLWVLYRLQIDEVEEERESIPFSEIVELIRTVDEGIDEEKLRLDLQLLESLGFVKTVGEEWTLSQSGALVSRTLELPGWTNPKMEPSG